MYRLVPALVRQMGAAYPELVRAETLIVETLLLEETRFKHLLERGLHLLAEETAPPRRPPAAARRGRVPPVRHLRLPARPDPGRVARARPHRRPRRLRGSDGRTTHPRPRRLGRLGRGGDRTGLVRDQGKASAPPNSSATPPRAPRAKSSRSSPAARRRKRAAGTDVAIVLNQTPFYGESGGQVGDTGVIAGADGLRIRVTDTQKKLGDLFVHLGASKPGRRVGAPVVATVDHARRTAIRAHHSATHLLHEALRRNSAPMWRRKAA